MKTKTIDLETELMHAMHTHEFLLDPDFKEAHMKLRKECFKTDEYADEKLVFAEHGGRIYFLFESRFPKRDPWTYVGKIPTDVQVQGEEAIRRHVEARKNTKLDPIKKQIVEDDRFCENSNIAVTVEHDGQILRGQILSGDGRYYALRMESPYHAEEPRLGGYNQWSAQSGVGMFSRDSEGKLCYSEHCLKGARDELIRMYKTENNRKHHPSVISIADRLNRR